MSTPTPGSTSTPAPTPVRLAVAGAGYIGQAHVAAARHTPGVVLCAVVDPSPAARAVADAAGVPLRASLDEMLTRDRPDALVLATPNHLHLPQALWAIEAGLPTLLEKPIATTVAEAQQIVAAANAAHAAHAANAANAAQAANARVLIGHHRAHSPIMDKAQQVVRSGQLGRLVAITGSATFYKPDQYFADGPWRQLPGGGPILINMIHEVHNLRMLCGDIVAVQAIESRAVRGFAVEDTVAINLRFANGALGSFMLSDTAASARSWEQTSQENKAYPSYDDEDCYVISGTHGSLSVPTMRLKTYPGDADRSWWKPFEVGQIGLVRQDPLLRQMAHFADVARGLATPKVSAQDGLDNLRVTEAIAQAAASGALVTL